MNNRMHWRLVVGRIVRISLGILFLLYIPSSLAQASLAELINALQAGGKIVYLRHAAILQVLPFHVFHRMIGCSMS